VREHDFEPVRGLPGDLPAGETLLWQGAPRWTRLACEVFHIRAVAAYFAAMLAWRTAGAVGAGVPWPRAVETSLMVAPLALAGLGLLAGLAWLTARTTVYSITSKRLVLRFGVALGKAINLPFTVIDSGALKAFADGSGDLAVKLKAPNKLAVLHLWPHVRPWRIGAPEPTLRAIPEAAAAARILASAMKAAVGVEITPVVATTPRTVQDAPRVRPEAAAA
jgi:hypothetical protein